MGSRGVERFHPRRGVEGHRAPRREQEGADSGRRAEATRVARERVETLDGDEFSNNWFRSKKSGVRSCRSSATARRLTDWQSDSPRR
jgi:hypothetical protein